MTFHPRHKLSTYALIAFFLFIAGYAYYEAQGLILGPRITINSDVKEMGDPFIRIEGEAMHVADLTMNGASIPVTEQGAFNEPYLLAPGDNYIFFEAKDKYGHKTTKVVEIVYNGPAASATSTSATASSTTPYAH